MPDQTLYITIKVQVKSDLDKQEIIDELSSECYYDFPSTENVEVVNTEWLDTSTQAPQI